MAQDKATRPEGEPNVSDALAEGAAGLDASLAKGSATISGYIPADASAGDAVDAGYISADPADAPDEEAPDAGMPGEDLTRDLADPEPFEVMDDEAEELDEVEVDRADETHAEAEEFTDEVADDDSALDGLLTDADEADPEGNEPQSTEVEIDDPKQLADAEAVAVVATSTRPVKRVKPKVKHADDDVDAQARGDARPARKKAEAPAKKEKETPSRKEAAPTKTRTTPFQFVRESVAELRKVVWPTGTQVQQYFVVVLIFVLFIIAFVGLLDLGLGWLLLKLLG